MKKTKKLMISENCFRLLFESDDDSESKIKELLNSSQKENIELAFMLMDSQNLDKERILQQYQETFDFLWSHGKINGNFLNQTKLNSRLFNKMLELKDLNLSYKEIENIPKLKLPNLISLNLTKNNIRVLPNLSLPNLKSLFIGGLQLTEVPIFNLPKLAVLFIGINGKITEIEKSIVSMFPNAKITVAN